MTDNQIEALRSLYDITGDVTDKGTVLVGRAEPRRLYAENEGFRVTCDHLTRESAGQIGEIVSLKEQRDELLEALQALTHSLDYADLLHDDQRKAFKHARSAIEKATGEKS